MKCMRSCSMHKCWENIYDWSEHSHRDPVANVVIYSSFAFFFGFVALGTVFKNANISALVKFDTAYRTRQNIGRDF